MAVRVCVMAALSCVFKRICARNTPIQPQKTLLNPKLHQVQSKPVQFQQIPTRNQPENGSNMLAVFAFQNGVYSNKASFNASQIIP